MGQLNDRLSNYDNRTDYLTYVEYSYHVAHLDWFDLEDHISFLFELDDLDGKALKGEKWATSQQLSRLISIAIDERDNRI